MYVCVDYMMCIFWVGVFFINDVHFVAVRVFEHCCIFYGCAYFSTLMCIFWVPVIFNTYFLFFGLVFFSMHMSIFIYFLI